MLWNIWIWYIMKYISSTLKTESEVSSEIFEHYLQSVTTSHPRRTYFNNQCCQNLERLMAKTNPVRARPQAQTEFPNLFFFNWKIHASNRTWLDLGEIKIHWDIQERNSWQDCLLQILWSTDSCMWTKLRQQAHVCRKTRLLLNGRTVMRTMESQRSAEPNCSAQTGTVSWSRVS